jgi:hypothetical protein
MFIAWGSGFKVKLRRSGMSLSPLTGLVMRMDFGNYKHFVPTGLL